MNRIPVRAIAAVLAAVVAVCELKGVAGLARLHPYAGMPVVLPRVEVIAAKPGMEQPVVADTAPAARLR
jgi:hypothetical protein